MRQLDGWKFSRQMPVGRFIADFMCREAKLVIELDGGQHNPERDKARTEYLNDQGFQIIRFWNNELTENEEGVLETIRSALPTSGPSRSREGS